MPVKDSKPAVWAKAVPSDVGSTDAATVTVPFTGSGYIIETVDVYNSKILATGATANGATASLSIRGGAGGTGTSIVADAALTGLTGSTVVLPRTVAATAVTPIVTDKTLYIRIGTASGVAGSGFDVCLTYRPLP